MGALDGIIVADFSRVLAGPLAAMNLGDLGAHVIKVEPPGGDETRSWKPPVDPEGRSTYFLTVNRNKRSIVLDLKEDVQLGMARELVARADVLVENFRPGTMERFGLGYEAVSMGNPGIVYCSISGFGAGGGATMPGYDPLVQAVSGMMSVTGPEGGEASKTGVAIVDVIAGLYATAGILAALRVRERDRIGQRIEINLLATALAALANQSSAYLNTGEAPSRLGNVHPSIEPFATFAAADGPMMICAGNDGQFRELVRVLGEPGLAGDARFATNADRVANRESLRTTLERLLSVGSVGYWTDRLTGAGVPAGPVNSIDQGFELADSLGLPVVDQVDDVRSPASPVRLSATPPETRLAPPELDQHGESVRAWLEAPRGSPPPA